MNQVVKPRTNKAEALLNCYPPPAFFIRGTNDNPLIIGKQRNVTSAGDVAVGILPF